VGGKESSVEKDEHYLETCVIIIRLCHYHSYLSLRQRGVSGFLRYYLAQWKKKNALCRKKKEERWRQWVSPASIESCIAMQK
jgi:hypothetical protein